MQNLVWEFISFIPVIENAARIWLKSLKESADCDLMFVSIWLMNEAVIARYLLGRDVLHFSFVTKERYLNLYVYISKGMRNYWRTL